MPVYTSLPPEAVSRGNKRQVPWWCFYVRNRPFFHQGSSIRERMLIVSAVINFSSLAIYSFSPPTSSAHVHIVQVVHEWGTSDRIRPAISFDHASPPPTKTIRDFSKSMSFFHTDINVYNNNNFEGQARNVRYILDGAHTSTWWGMRLVSCLRPIWTILESYACMWPSPPEEGIPLPVWSLLTRASFFDLVG